MPNVQVSYPAMPKLLDVVNRILREVGAYPVPSLNPGSTQSQVALDAVNDGIWQIYNRNRWSWTNTTIYIPLVANQTDYSVPADFDRLSQSPIYNGYVLSEYTPDEWTQRVSGLADMASTQPGAPICFKLTANVMTVFPAPVASVIAVVPSIQFSYYKNPGTRLDNTDDAVGPNLPIEFVDCLVTFGKWRLKAFMEYPDAQLEAQRFEQLLSIQMNRNLRGRKPNQMRQQYEPAGTAAGGWGWF